MSVWIIEPRDPLIVRDGRPFGPNPGARATTLSFPFPSTTTGGARTRAGLKDGIFDRSRVDEVKGISVRGPLLVGLDEQGEIHQWLAPAPADALLLELKLRGGATSKKKARRKLMVPLDAFSGAKSDLPGNHVGPVRAEPEKPLKDAPRFWYWSAFEEWLRDPHDDSVTLTKLGWRGPLPEKRMHVSIDPETLTGVDGALFMTSGLEFARSAASEKAKLPAVALGMAVDTPAAIQAGMAPLGGERRLVCWRKSEKQWPSLPPAVMEAILRDEACRLILLTPACFERGYHPGRLLEEQGGVRPELMAASVPRFQVISGWDLATKGPKPTRRLVPAGAVYFLKLHGEKAAIQQWLESTWMSCVSDEEQDCLDGFGLAVLGAWSGEPQKMEDPL